MRKLILTSCILLPLFVKAQVLGGERSMEFLRLSQSAHVSAMGGLCVNNPSGDVSLATANPALLRKLFHSHLSLNFNNFYAGSKFMSMNYAHHASKLNTTFGFAVQYLNHGSMLATDALGNSFGEIKANEYSIQLSAARSYKDNWRYGSTIKLANSRLGDKVATAMLVDFGVTYSDTNRNWYIGGVFKNAGARLRNYTSQQGQPLPFDFQIGFLKKFAKAPFSIYAIGHHLYTWDIRYDNPADRVNNQLIFGDTTATKEKLYLADKIFRHINVGVGLNLGKRLEVNVGYNHLRRKEIGLAAKKGMAGFSLGATFLLNKMIINYAQSHYHLAGAQHEIGLTMKMDKLFGIDKLRIH